jgi:hypothetical protein
MFTPYLGLDQRHALATSARPGAPVVPVPAEQLPGRARITISALLRSVADAFADERQVLAAR